MAEPIHIVGAGLAGSLMAVYRAKRGQAVHLWDRRPDLRRSDIPAGRSINLAISTRGLTALDRIGMRETILDQAVPGSNDVFVFGKAQTAGSRLRVVAAGRG